MPTVKSDESLEQYLERCVPVVLKEQGTKSREHAVAKCNGMWEQSREVDNSFCPTGKGGGVDPSCGKGSTESPKSNTSISQSILNDHRSKRGLVRYTAIRDSIATEAKNRGYTVHRSDSNSTNSVYLVIGKKTEHGGISSDLQVRISDHATSFKRTGVLKDRVNLIGSRITVDHLTKILDRLPSMGREGEEILLNESSSFPIPPGIQVLKTNAFCPTGKGGGVDPTCSPGKGGSVNEKKFYLSAVVKFGHKKSSQAVNSLVTLRISPRPVEISDKDVSVLKSFGMEFDKIESDFYHIKDTPTNRSIVEAANQIFNYINGDSEFGPAAVKRQAEALSKRAEQWSKGTDDPGLSLTWAITQSAIKKSHVELYRGLAMKDSTTHKRIEKASLKSVKVSNVGHWTTDRRIASQFAESYASTKRSNPLVLSVKVPKKDILFSFHQFGTAGGLAREKEHVPVLKNTNLKVSSQKIRTDVWDVSYASVELSYGR